MKFSLPVCAIFVDVVDRTAHLLKSFVWWRKWQRAIKNRQRMAVLLEMPCHEVHGQPFPAFFLWELGWCCSLSPAVVILQSALQSWGCLWAASAAPAAEGGREAPGEVGVHIWYPSTTPPGAVSDPGSVDGHRFFFSFSCIPGLHTSSWMSL